MESMQCVSCVQKHLANALSYGKEIMSGHNRGAALDHRIDFLGELGNAEHHLELIDKELFLSISQFRKDMQEKNITPDYADLDKIRKLFLAVDHYFQEEKIEPGDPNSTFAIAGNMPDIVFPKITNSEYFKIVWESIQKYARGWDRIFYLESTIDLTEFGIKQISGLDDPELGDTFLYWQENMCLLKHIDLQRLNPIYAFTPGKPEYTEIIPQIRKNNQERPIYLYDGIAPQPIQKEPFLELTSGIETAYPLTLYFNSLKTLNAANAASIAVHVDKKICCSVKSKLRNCVYATWNDAGFEHLKQYLNERNQKK